MYRCRYNTEATAYNNRRHVGARCSVNRNWSMVADKLTADLLQIQNDDGSA